VKVLIVDDAAPVRARLGEMVAELPGVASVVEADTCALAVEVLCAWGPDVIVVDLHLRGESGLGLLSLAKRNRPEALLIVMTSHPTARHRRQCLALGADHFLDKSRDFEQVLRILAEAIGPTRTLESSDE
jgi:two-component system, OmpR family, response regulator